MDVLDDPAELGKRIAASRGYAGETVESFAPLIEVTPPTLRSYERGKLGDYGGSRELRQALAEKVQRASGAPPSWLGLDEEPGLTRERIEELRRAVGALATLQTVPDLGDAARRLLEAELAVARQWSTSSQPTEEPGSEAASG